MGGSSLPQVPNGDAAGTDAAALPVLVLSQACPSAPPPSAVGRAGRIVNI